MVKLAILVNSCILNTVVGLSARLSRVSVRVPSAEDARKAVAKYESLFPSLESIDSSQAEAMDLVFEKSQFAIELNWSDRIKPYEADKNGLLGIGVEVEDSTILGEEIELNEQSLVASLVPDEDPSKETKLQMKKLDEPVGGIPLEIISKSSETTSKAASQLQPKIVLCVSDIDASIAFYTNALGMRLLRKRSLLPETAAMVAFLSFSPYDADELLDSPEGADGLATPRIELRYIYGNDDISPDTGLGEFIITNCSDTAGHAANIDEWGGHASEIADSGALQFTDPDGYCFRLEPSAT